MNAAAFAAPWLCTLAAVFESAGRPLYAVGGIVRNALMGLPASDVDVCGPATPQEVAHLCEGTPVRAVARAAHFGTVELHVSDGDGRHMAEYTTFRVDSYRGGHQPSAVRFAQTPEVDALRRDPQADVAQGWPQLARLDGSGAGEGEFEGNPLEGFPHYITGSVFRRSVFERVGLFDPELRFGEDTDWFNRAREHGARLLRLDCVSVIVRRHGGNMTYGKNLVQLNVLRVAKKVLDRRRAAAR